MIQRLFMLWVEGLAAALVAVEALLHPPRRFLLRSDSRPFKLYPAGEAVAPEPLLTINEDRLDKIPDGVLEATRGGVIEIVVPDAAILQRRLDVLPAESLPYVENVVLHQLDRMFPWRAADVLHATLIEKRADGKLDVSVRATAHSAIASALAAAEVCGAGEILVRGSGEDDANKAPAASILAAIGSEKKNKLDRTRLVARYAIVALLALAASVVGWTIFAGWSLSADVAALDQQIVDRRAILKRAADATGAGQNRGLDAKRALAPSAVVVLDELSAILPDNTYLTDLSMDGEHLRITGVSANAAELVPLLEGSRHFKNATFYAPTTRLAGGATDRFSIEATVVPQSAEGQ